ncbi:MAG: glycerol-3-phosphate acyltransferase [Deltaproteobacteria bacterium]|nr:glycerol-3-phosphate acyltransferase [Deltaproteobacteria bacterium]
MLLRIVFLLIFTYIASSVNFSIVLFKILGKEDPRNKFSGNAGATNVYRQAGFFWAALILLLDMGRAMLISFVSLHFLDYQYATFPGFALILGNRFPCFHQFRGGKGVANYLGFTLILAPISTLIASLAWLLVFLLFRVPFISSFVMILILGAGTVQLFSDHLAAMAAALATVAFILINHKQNLIEFREKINK